MLDLMVSVNKQLLLKNCLLSALAIIRSYLPFTIVIIRNCLLSAMVIIWSYLLYAILIGVTISTLVIIGIYPLSV